MTLLTLTHCQRHKANGSVSIFEFVFSKLVFVKFVLCKLVSSRHLMEGSSGYMRTASVTITALQQQVSRNGDSAMMRAPHDLFSNNSLGNETVLSLFDLVDNSSENTSSSASTKLSTIIGSYPSTTSTTTDSDPFDVVQMKMELQKMQLPGVVVSIVLILVTMISCEILYRLILKNVIPGLFRSIVLDFLSGGEAVVVSWELITVFHQYGQPLWALLSYFAMTAKLYRYRVEVIACPYTHLQSLLRGWITPREASARILAQFVGAEVFFSWQARIWDWGLTRVHLGRSYWMAYGRCAAWLDVPNVVGFCWEFGGGLVCGVAGILIFDWELFPVASIHKRIAASTSITLLAVLAAFHKTGGFFQPLLAFGRTFGCVGVLRPVSLVDHLLVYWLGASLGAVVSMYVAPPIKRLLLRVPYMRRGNKLQTLPAVEEGKGLLEEEDDEEVVFPRRRASSTSNRNTED